MTLGDKIMIVDKLRVGMSTAAVDRRPLTFYFQV
jgi:hypothetical protein